MRVSILLSLTSLLLSAHTAPPPGTDGYYIAGHILCTNHASCVHEVGHKLDDEAGWISATPEYVGTVEWLMLTTSTAADNPLAFEVFTKFFYTPHGHADQAQLRELYAEMFEAADGQRERVHGMFQHFYDWDRAAELLSVYAPVRNGSPAGQSGAFGREAVDDGCDGKNSTT
jgi:hypothetical protein